MKITKTVERFDASVFEPFQTYYISYDDNDSQFEGIFQCREIFTQYHEVVMSPIIALKGRFDSICISQSNVDYVKEVQPIDWQIEYDTMWKQWSVMAQIDTKDN